MAVKFARTALCALVRGWIGETLRRTMAPNRDFVKTVPPIFFRASPTTAENTILAMVMSPPVGRIGL
jgi:hypothetical protein